MSQSQQITNYLRLHSMLSIKHSKYVELFVQWYKDEEFEDGQLLDEFIDTKDDYNDSFFIEYLQNKFKDDPMFNNQIAKSIFDDCYRTVKSFQYIKKQNMLYSRGNSFQTLPFEHWQSILITRYINDIIITLSININVPQEIFAFLLSYIPNEC